MKFKTVLSAAAAIAALSGSIALADSGPKWRVDPVHSSAQFTATHLAISHVTGTIPIVNATVIVADGSDIPTSMSATLDPAKIDTHNGNRDDDLRSKNFFDTANYTNITFQSTNVTGSGKNFDITGNLTMHGVTKPVTLHGTFLGRGPGMKPGEQRIAYTADGTLNRSEWGMTTYITPPIVSDQIALHLEVEAIKQ